MILIIAKGSTIYSCYILKAKLHACARQFWVFKGNKKADLVHLLNTPILHIIFYWTFSCWTSYFILSVLAKGKQMQKELVHHFVSLIILFWNLVKFVLSALHVVFSFHFSPSTGNKLQCKFFIWEMRPGSCNYIERSWGLTFCQYSRLLKSNMPVF